jgi:vanillate O-demethylase monooxygenase subunit
MQEDSMTTTSPLSEPRIPPAEGRFDPADRDVLSRYWHPVAWSHELVEQPLSAALLDERLVVYRTTAGVVVAKDLCLHRGAPLTLGWVEGDEIVCAYHGFRYGPDGYCTRVPAHPGLGISHKLRLTTYPALEQHGIVWTCLSGQPLAPPPDWPEADDALYRKLHLSPEDWDASAARMIENFLDIAHFSWIHDGTFGNRAHPEMTPYAVTTTPSGFEYGYDYLAANPGGGPLPDEQVIQRHMSYEVVMPFAVRLAIHYPGDRRHVVMTAAAPVSARRVRIFFFIARNFDHQVAAEVLLDWERNILSQDRRVVERQRPEELPLDLSEEFHIKADAASLAYRKALRRIGLGAPLSS